MEVRPYLSYPRRTQNETRKRNSTSPQRNQRRSKRSVVRNDSLTNRTAHRSEHILLRGGECSVPLNSISDTNGQNGQNGQTGNWVMQCKETQWLLFGIL